MRKITLFLILAVLLSDAAVGQQTQCSQQPTLEHGDATGQADVPFRGGIFSFSPDGRQIFTGGVRDVSIWESSNGELVDTVPIAWSGPRILDVSADGRWLNSYGSNDFVKVDLRSGSATAIAHEGLAPAGAMALDPSRGELIVVTYPTITVLSTETGAVLRRFGAPDYAGTPLGYSSATGWIALAKRDGTVQILDGGDGHLLRERKLPQQDIWDLKFNRSGTLLVTVARGGVRLWDARTFESLGDLPATKTGKPGDFGGPYTVAFFDEDRQLVAGAGGLLRIWDLQTRRNTRNIEAWQRYAAEHIAVSPDGTRVAATNQAGTVGIWSLQTGEKLVGLPEADDAAREGEDPARPSNLQAADYVYDGNLPCGALARIGVPGLRNPGDIVSLSTSADNRVLATGSRDRTIRVWDLSRWQEVREIVVPWVDPAGWGPHNYRDDDLHAIALSPNGRFVAFAGAEEAVRIFRVADGKQVREISAGETRGILYSPDGKRLFTSADAITAWSVTTGKRLFRRRACNRCGLELLSSTRYAEVRPAGPDLRQQAITVRDMRTRRPVIRYTVPFAGALRFSADGMYVAPADGSGNIFDVRSGQSRRINVWPGNSIALSPSGGLLLAGGGLFQTSDASLRKEIPLQELGPRFGGFSRDGKIMFAAGEDGELRAWDLVTGAPLRPQPRLEDAVFAPGAGRVVTHDGVSSVDVWDLESGQKTWHAGLPGVTAAAIGADGRSAAAVTRPNRRDWIRTVSVWHVGDDVAALRFQLPRLRSISTPDRQHLRFIGPGLVLLQDLYGTPEEIDLDSQKQRQPELPPLPGAQVITHVVPQAFADGGRLWAGRAGATAWIWPRDDNAQARSLGWVDGVAPSVLHPAPFEGIALSEDGAALATASQWGWPDGAVRLWDVAAAEKRTRFTTAFQVTAMAFTPDRSVLAVGTAPGLIYLWDSNSHQTLRRLAGHIGPVRRLAFRPDGKRLYSYSDDGTVVTWNTEVMR